MYKPVKGELLKFQTRDGFILEGFLARPRNAKLCIVYLHDWGGNFYRELSLGLMSGLDKRGIAIFSINTRGHDTVSKIPDTKSKKRFLFNGGVELEKFEDTIFDIEGALKALRRLGFKKFVLCGHSTGCQKITYYQYKRNDKSVKALVLVAPGDDYNIWKRTILGRNFNQTVRTAKKLVKQGRGDQLNFTENATPKRFLSVADPKNVEARLFDYDGELKEFGKIRIPVLALFGSREEHSLKPVSQYLKILEKKSNSKHFQSHLVEGAKHSFTGHEDEVADLITKFVSSLPS